jgi:serine O-acetyltransferase
MGELVNNQGRGGPRAQTTPRRSRATPAGEGLLDGVVAQLGALRRRSHQNRYGERVLPELPSRPATVEIVDGVAAALFPRHYGPKDLTYDRVDAFVTETLERAFASLARQAKLELELTGATARLAPAPAQIAQRFAEALPRIRATLETDIQAAYEGDPAATSIDEVMCCYPGIAAVIRHRVAHELYRLGLPMLARITAEVAHSMTGIDIHPGATIGASFFIDHGTGVVIGETAELGERVRLYQGVTLGARRFEVDARGALVKNYPRHPVIADDVVIYAGASVLGRITVGQGSTIAGNVWLTHSVPPGSVNTQAATRRDALGDGGGI